MTYYEVPTKEEAVAGMVPDIKFVKTEQALVVEGSQRHEGSSFFGHVLPEAFIMVAGDKIEGSVWCGRTETQQQRIRQVDLILKAVEPLVRSVPPADLMEVREITKVNDTVRLQDAREIDGAFYKLFIDIRNVRVRKKENDFFAGVDGTN